MPDYFSRSAGVVTPIVRPGDPMPGGGTLVRTFGSTSFLHLNNAGGITFFGLLNTGKVGLYLSSGGVLRLIAVTGTVLPGVGTIEAVLGPGGVMNERGEVLFWAIVGGRGVLVLATPSPNAA